MLAGFHDGRAIEGNTGGVATLVGLKYAKERGWRAPCLLYTSRCV